MIDAFIAGRLYGQAAERVAKNGSRFAVAKVRVALRDGTAIFVNCITFHASAVTALMALSDGDSIALAGELTPKVWTDREGTAKPSLDLMVHAVLTAYNVSRKRATMAHDSNTNAGPREGEALDDLADGRWSA